MNSEFPQENVFFCVQSTVRAAGGAARFVALARCFCPDGDLPGFFAAAWGNLAVFRVK